MRVKQRRLEHSVGERRCEGPSKALGCPVDPPLSQEQRKGRRKHFPDCFLIIYVFCCLNTYAMINNIITVLMAIA